MSVFLVDEGKMLPMDLNLTTKSVEYLKEKIASRMHIPVANQVLLVNGGESIDSQESVCSYSSGTDSDPIYLFSNNLLEEDERPPITATGFGTIELIDRKTQIFLDRTYSGFRKRLTELSASLPESYWASFRSFQKYLEVTRKGKYPWNKNLLSKIEDALCLPATYKTVVNRVYLSQYMYEHDNCIYKYCKNLVNELHLQQRGWLAAVANLKATTQYFNKSARKFKENYTNYLKSRKDWFKLLTNFSQDIKEMDRLPLLPGLIPKYESENISFPSENISLYQWLNSQEKNRSVEQIAEFCVKGLEHYNVKFFQTVQSETSNLLDKANNANMAVITRLDEQLKTITEMLQESKDKVERQKHHSKTIQSNAQCAGNEKNASILVDLCANHEEQLLLMRKTHEYIYTLLNKFHDSKDQLSQILHIRLAWITSVQKSMCAMNSKLNYYSDNLKRLRCHLELLKQIHEAPELYMTAVTEVLRRKAFTNVFLEWSTSISKQASDLYEKETMQRKAFADKINKHFLHTLFQGMDDNLPAFAVKPPKPFDTKLPPVCIGPADVENLRQFFPDFASFLEMNNTHFPILCGKFPETRTNIIQKIDNRETIDNICATSFSAENVKQSLPTSTYDAKKSDNSNITSHSGLQNMKECGKRNTKCEPSLAKSSQVNSNFPSLEYFVQLKQCFPAYAVSINVVHALATRFEQSSASGSQSSDSGNCSSNAHDLNWSFDA